MEPILHFQSVNHLAPKCGGCQRIISYGVDTRFDDKKQTMVCTFCGSLV